MSSSAATHTATPPPPLLEMAAALSLGLRRPLGAVACYVGAGSHHARRAIQPLLRQTSAAALSEPKTFEVGATTLVISTEAGQPQQLGVHPHPDSASGGWTGGTVWKSGAILTRFLAESYHPPPAADGGGSSWADCRVLELGSGCGAAGLAAAALGAKQVVLTDQVLHQARINRDANHFEASQVQLRPLIWSEKAADVLQSLRAHGIAGQEEAVDCAPPFDLLLGSDILYSEASHGDHDHLTHDLARAVLGFHSGFPRRCCVAGALAQTIAALSGPGTVVLLCTPIGQANGATVGSFFEGMRRLGFSCEDVSAEAGLEASEGDSDGSAVMLYSPDGELESM